MIAGPILFPLINTGVVLNTTFLVREVRRNEQHENFINAVTHELKTPIASVKLHLQTLQQRPVDEAKRQEFYSATHYWLDALALAGYRPDLPIITPDTDQGGRNLASHAPSGPNVYLTPSGAQQYSAFTVERDWPTDPGWWL